MKAPLSAFAIVGLLAVVALLGQHSRMLIQERESARAQVTSVTTERDKAKAEAEAAHAHEAELQAALKVGEQVARNLQQQHDKAMEGVRNAKPNDCTDAAVADDIDRILRDETTRQNLGYLPRPAKRTDSARDSEVARRNQPRHGEVLFASAARCTSL